ncbi:hypothetical protein [Arenibacter certesii]|uniref:Uncharacterized protein n=1 Tax=Arenibacter certesii TaxID=228955 RepID=A0A918IYR3_9FLAO|nr:hypothetical protein [Arenibacter certesii]GGW34686.1 hypothetical protein GCM10007383_19680 [Arenibacter certesii]
MKIIFYSIVFVILGSIITSCDKDDINHQNDFEKSVNAWLDFKEKSNNSYEYVVQGTSWTGLRWETTIQVAEGTTIQRHFKYTSTEGLTADIPEEELEWTENGSGINSRTNTIAAQALTLDEIYEKAKKEWLIDRKNTKTFFEAENDGLISSCGYVENGCMDDCFVGISLKNIR